MRAPPGLHFGSQLFVAIANRVQRFAAAVDDVHEL
jgi:hypothetical protein